MLMKKKPIATIVIGNLKKSNRGLSEHKMPEDVPMPSEEDGKKQACLEALGDFKAMLEKGDLEAAHMAFQDYMELASIENSEYGYSEK